MMARLLFILVMLLLPMPHIEAQEKVARSAEKTAQKPKTGSEPKNSKAAKTAKDTKKPKTAKSSKTSKTQQKWKKTRQRLKEKQAEVKEKVKVKMVEVKAQGELAKAKADSLLDVRNSKLTTDTLWVARPQSKWTFRGKADGSGELLEVRAEAPNGANVERYRLQSDMKVTLGVMANYRGISLSAGLSPTQLLSDLSDIMSSINYYSNRFGIDLDYERLSSFRGKNLTSGNSRKLHGTRLNSFSAVGYYVFNGKRFSYPAVFNSTWMQKRSAGSFLVQASFYTGKLKSSDDLHLYKKEVGQLQHIDMNHFSIGVGYGYNFVYGKHWLIHLSVQPSTMIWRNFTLRYTDNNDVDPQTHKQKMPANRFNVYLVGRAGVTYSWERYFAGMTGVVQHSKTGEDNDFSLRTSKWKVRLFMGLRL